MRHFRTGAMFTGLVEGVGEITGVSRLAEGLKLAVAPPFPTGDLALGDSVAVAGACLTVVEISSRKAALGERREGPASLLLKFEMPGPLSRYVIEKGSIAIDGVSLTVNTCQGNAFTVNIIPHTVQKTTLARLRVGDEVNLETDIIGKYVEKLLGGRTPEKTEGTAELLARQ